MLDLSQKKAVIFDMDGTLVDSELFTEMSVSSLLKGHGIDQGDLDLRQYHGITWESISRHLKQSFPTLADVDVSAFLQNSFHELFMSDEMAYIPGALDFFRLTCKHKKAAIATSSNRQSVEFLVNKMQVQNDIDLILSAEDYELSKPDPQCYQQAAIKLGLKTGECVVFEDSIPGLKAGRSAGMTTVAICMHALDMDLVRSNSDFQIQDYKALTAKVFENG